MTENEILSRGLAELGLPGEGEQARKLTLYLRELEKWNPLFGLVGSRGRDLVVRHLLDSLAGRASIAAREPRRLADLGSGAGLPGIPLALYMPRTDVTPVEPSAKRCAFLRSAAALLGLPHLRIFEGGAETLRETFDLVTFRAFRPLDRRTLRCLAAILAPGGRIAAYKARREKIDDEAQEARALGYAVRVEELSAPFLEEPRHLLWLSIPPSPAP